MSATFNYELFANYFSKSSVKGIESMTVYEGAEKAYEDEEKKRKEREEQGWGPAKADDWINAKGPSTADEDKDEWIVTKPLEKIPIQK